MTSKSNPRQQGQDVSKEALPWTHEIVAEHIPEGGFDTTIAANSEQRAALAALDGLVAIGELKAAFHVAPRPGRGLHVTGRVTGRITQVCVVSLEEFEEAIAEDVDVDFLPAEALAKLEQENALIRDRGQPIEEEADLPDPIIDGKIDLGGLAAEFLALALDPYPRKPGAHFDEVPGGDEREFPFAVLKALKR